MKLPPKQFVLQTTFLINQNYETYRISNWACGSGDIVMVCETVSGGLDSSLVLSLSENVILVPTGKWWVISHSFASKKLRVKLFLYKRQIVCKIVYISIGVEIHHYIFLKMNSLWSLVFFNSFNKFKYLPAEGQIFCFHSFPATLQTAAGCHKNNKKVE